jgi:DnaJ-class molecular chaperone
MDIQRCYELLELKANASMHEVKQAYRDISDVWHPDRFSHNFRLKKKAEKKLKDINEAYVMLATHLNGGKRITEDKKGSEDSEEEQKNSKVEKGVSLEDFFEFGTFLTLRMWSGLSSSLNRILKKTDQRN